MIEVIEYDGDVEELDSFLGMTLSAQALYFHFSRNADEDGAVYNPRAIARMIGATENDIVELITNEFIREHKNG